MSDHFSGPRAIAGPAGDIADIYAFPSPSQPGRLVMVMNVLPNARPDSFFSDAITCRFRLRPLHLSASGRETAFKFGPEETEQTFTCTFESPSRGAGEPAARQRGRCISPDGQTADFVVNDDQGGVAGGLRVYAGLRSDPFFLDLTALKETITSGRLAFKEAGMNSLAGFNVLSIVIETDCAPIIQAASGPLIAIVGETVVAGKLPVRLERVGRPEIKNVLMATKEFDTVNRDMELRDLYNLEDAFHMSKDYRGAYRARLNANLAFFDRVDGVTDWELDALGNHPLTELLLADFLVMDISKPYAEDSFFEIERAALENRPHDSCGGRSLNENVMDTIYTLLINAGHGPRITDGVHHATVPALLTYPFLAPPSTHLTDAESRAVMPKGEQP